MTPPHGFPNGRGAFVSLSVELASDLDCLSPDWRAEPPSASLRQSRNLAPFASPRYGVFSCALAAIMSLGSSPERMDHLGASNSALFFGNAQACWRIASNPQ